MLPAGGCGTAWCQSSAQHRCANAPKVSRTWWISTIADYRWQWCGKIVHVHVANDCYYIENFHSVCIVFAQVLIAMAKVMKQPTIVERLFEASKFEYKTRHLIDGRIVQCDQRISIVAGYMADEVSGLSPFTFMHRDDVRWVMVALRQSKFSTKVCLFIRDRNQQVHKQMSYVPHASCRIFPNEKHILNCNQIYERLMQKIRYRRRQKQNP